jgi:predicted dehydrogenase
MLKIAVLGAGHLGKIHLKVIQELTGYYDLIGFYDASPETAEKVSRELGVKAYSQIDELITQVDVVDIVTPTLSHFKCARASLKKFKHVFIEKPVTATVDEAKILSDLAREASVKVQVGHVERFNPAFQAALPHFKQPLFIEAHRLAQFNPRGTDVSVVLDLMIHDIDIILSVVKSGVKNVSASGVAVVSDSPDITNARIEFDNGCVANLTASRISLKNMRKTRFFQRDAYISVDFLQKSAEIVRMKDIQGEPGPFDITFDVPGKGTKQIFFEKPTIQPVNAIKEELLSFYNAIIHNDEPAVSLIDGLNALDLAYKIIEKTGEIKNKLLI